MNFRRLKITDGISGYQNLKSLSANNFYFVLAQKLVNHPTLTKLNTELEMRVLGNVVLAKTTKDGVALTVNGYTVTGSGKRFKAFEDVIYNLFQAELNNKVSINRPDGRTLLQDRTEFNRASGTMFPKLYKSVTKDKEGIKHGELLKSRSSVLVYTESAFNKAKSIKTFKTDNFESVDTPSGVLYVNKTADFINFDNSLDVSYQRFSSILMNLEGNLDIWSRIPEFVKLYSNIESYKNTVVYFKGFVWTVVSSERTFTVNLVIKP